MEQQILETQNMKKKTLDREAFNYILVEKTEKRRTYADIAVDLNQLGYAHHIGRPLTGLDVSIFCTRNGFRIVKGYRKRKTKTKDGLILTQTRKPELYPTIENVKKEIIQNKYENKSFSKLALCAAEIVDDNSMSSSEKLKMLSKLV